MARTQAAPPPIQVLPVQVQLMTPYLPLLLTARNSSAWSCLSMEELQTTPGSTSFLVDAAGKVIWTSDSPISWRARSKTPGSQADLSAFAGRAVALRDATTQEVGTEGILTSQSVGTTVAASGTAPWALMALSYKPMLFFPIEFAFRQFLLL